MSFWGGVGRDRMDDVAVGGMPVKTIFFFCFGGMPFGDGWLNVEDAR